MRSWAQEPRGWNPANRPGTWRTRPGCRLARLSRSELAEIDPPHRPEGPPFERVPARADGCRRGPRVAALGVPRDRVRRPPVARRPRRRRAVTSAPPGGLGPSRRRALDRGAGGRPAVDLGAPRRARARAEGGVRLPAGRSGDPGEVVLRPVGHVDAVERRARDRRKTTRALSPPSPRSIGHTGAQARPRARASSLHPRPVRGPRPGRSTDPTSRRARAGTSSSGPTSALAGAGGGRGSDRRRRGARWGERPDGVAPSA